MQAADGRLRIGELSRRVGVAPELLRAWESRYTLLEPSRSPGGFRLYSSDDERRVRAMLANLARGYSAAEAARLVLSRGPEPEPVAVDAVDPAADVRELRAALDAYDEAGANRTLDRMLATLSLETVLRVVLGYLHELGERWERGEASVAQEHFASNVLRGRLLGLARGWGQGGGERALLACAPGEQHDLAVIVFGLALRARGFRVTYLGADTPIDTLADAVTELTPSVTVVGITSASLGPETEALLRGLAARTRLAFGGPGATQELAEAVGAELLAGDPFAEADRITALQPRSRSTTAT
jgi:DNA-binding transcriptional MerR regulator